MPLFPMFIDLSDSAVLVVGRGAEADRKVEKMRPFCRKVLCSDYPPEYDETPALVILAEKDHPENEHWAVHFRRQHIPVNVSDRPELCDFRFPSMIVNGDVSVGISTDGKSPSLGALLRERIEEALPEDLEAIARRAAELTAQLRHTTPNQTERARLIKEELKKLL